MTIFSRKASASQRFCVETNCGIPSGRKGIARIRGRPRHPTVASKSSAGHKGTCTERDLRMEKACSGDEDLGWPLVGSRRKRRCCYRLRTERTSAWEPEVNKWIRCVQPAQGRQMNNTTYGTRVRRYGGIQCISLLAQTRPFPESAWHHDLHRSCDQKKNGAKLGR